MNNKFEIKYYSIQNKLEVIKLVKSSLESMTSAFGESEYFWEFRDCREKLLDIIKCFEDELFEDKFKKNE